MTNITTLRQGASQPKEPVRLIDANDVIQNVLDEIRYKESLYTLTVRRIAQRAIDAAPTIDPESLRPTAHWISDSGGSTNVVCSACNAISFAAYNFCPECGKRMVNADEKHCT
jgi:hypothetical protein